ncbi:hypothetical protein GGX14DRAFT_590012 [Mycena pura]|uniref:GDS1 winged helix domain-containing protein n=1 Tax=Mycena pura TaxID=153505 RepID=A0AAD6VW60_9AGAR|nr:hypothetical protein GGX14DRAFT_590012 [Mycena pura]
MSTPQLPTQHTYGTRIRHNVRIKPSARLRDLQPPSATPLRPKLAAQHVLPHSDLLFPPPHVVLHPDDATSKVFLALGRALMSVDNRAMTIKDLSEMTVVQGLVCQNVSAASQAITTYIRNHLQRCESQQDHPLLLRHTLSGTPDDDDLLPALYSTSGGAHCGINTDNRTTNFRRGTMVWYLSGATGAPCPFARAGIMLCEYAENGRVESQHATPRDKRLLRDRPEQCGSKRKRSLRGCAPAHSDSDSSMEQVRPPKVKLTLRLKPLRAFASTEHAAPSPSPQPIDVSDHSMSSEDESDDEPPQEPEWSLPPYPRRSISIPCYTPSIDGPSYYYPQTPYQRSSSVPYSVASPPPDSEDDNDDYHISMTGSRRVRSRALKVDQDSDWDEWDADADDDSEGDGETMWESPGPRSPSAPAAAEVEVKQEPRDPLDHWDSFDGFGLPSDHVKVELEDEWDWLAAGRPGSDDIHHIKQEDDLESLSLSSSFDNFRDPGPSSPLSPLASSEPPLFSFESPRRASDPLWRESDTPELELDRTGGMVRPRSKTVPSLSAFFSVPEPLARKRPPPLVTQTLASLIQSMSMNGPTATTSSSHPPCISPQDTRCDGWTAETVVVHTCVPCTPAISATQVEGISVYQMTLGTHTLLRRLDTDFVNLSPIVGFSGAPYPVLSTIPNATVISRGSPAVRGTWVPLSAAQAYIRDHPLPNGVLDVFLSERLASRFPPALAEWREGASGPGRGLGVCVFGRHFGSTVQATALCGAGVGDGVAERRELDVAALLTPVAPAFAAASATELESDPDPELESDLGREQPLSSTEQQIFRELFVTTEWDREAEKEREQEPPSPLSDVPPDIEAVPEPAGRRLRRSTRVANAKSAAKERTRSRRRS